MAIIEWSSPSILSFKLDDIIFLAIGELHYVIYNVIRYSNGMLNTTSSLVIGTAAWIPRLTSS